MNGRCPSPTDLVVRLLGDGGEGRRVGRHVEECASCRRELEHLRHAAAALRASALAAPDPSTSCLDEDAISRLAEGRPAHSEATLAHLLGCSRCRRRLVAVRQLLGDPAVTAEVRRISGPFSGHGGRPGRAIIVMALATAAGVTALLLIPRSALTPPSHDAAPSLEREGAITTTAAPRILGPAGPAAPGDSLRWTSVPHADRYEVGVFDREGTVVWNPETRDTILPIPEPLFGSGTTTYLWRVKARTGFDRWVASEWADLTTSPAGRRER